VLGAIPGLRIGLTPGEDALPPLPSEMLVVTTIVSSRLLSRIADVTGAVYAETLTGFKWIARAADSHPGSAFAFGYEEALGYLVGDTVRDKDGIGAALALLSLATRCRAQGTSLTEAYDALEAEHGVHLTEQVTVPAKAPGQVMAALRAAAPAELGGEPVTAVSDLSGGTGALPPADVLIYELAGARVVIRPSGTEPKVKAYIEVVAPVTWMLTEPREATAARMTALRGSVQGLLAD
jgi:phosphomannomutase